ncbi:NPCBM/NEW2 domain-containing protein [Paenibacillus cellulosilyticus]|uniref:NPCBM/NEW2 domain-containing protein n=1 Tax=Paenibacillus cellulosilyticus TaxID=375489 RepID=UPI001580458E|nr:NPCBM/NEW2 domain-containing protein [Paenibacillus cellulosilyticus]QKS45052.1 NPCBM/NEW2 domain-containing protein [Paenibacillus cellulosilyticus]
MSDKLKGLVTGLLIGTMITGGAAYAATSTKIEVVIDNLKYMVDGVQMKPTTGQGFIYQGTTYVPLRFAAEAVGKEVTWEGKSKTIWIGKKEGAFKYLSSIDYARAEGVAVDGLRFDKWKDGSSFIVAENKYVNGIGMYFPNDFWNKALSGTVDYNLNGKYSKFVGKIGVDDIYKNSTSVGVIKIFGDGELLYTSTDLIGGNLPIDLNVDITGVLKLRIQFEFNNNQDIAFVIGDAKVS